MGLGGGIFKLHEFLCSSFPCMNFFKGQSLAQICFLLGKSLEGHFPGLIAVHDTRPCLVSYPEEMHLHYLPAVA